MVNFGGSNNFPNFNPNYNLYPILRVPDSSLLYLDMNYWVNFTENGELDTANAEMYQINYNVPAGPFCKFFNFFGVDRTPDNFELLTNYPMTDANVVTLSSHFQTTINAVDPQPALSGMLMICKDCWNAFDDATYFDWSNTCTTFQLCSYNHSNYTNPHTQTSLIACNPVSKILAFDTIIKNNHQSGYNGLIKHYQHRITLCLQSPLGCYILAFPLPCGPTAQSIMLLLERIMCFGLHYIASPTTVQLKISVIAPFDGNTVNMVINLNNTAGRFGVFGIVLNYTNPVNCQPQSASQTFTQTFSQVTACQLRPHVITVVSETCRSRRLLTPTLGQRTHSRSR